MIWPERLLASPPPVKIPKGYVLRQYRDGDEPAYTELMHKAGFTFWNHDSMTGLLGTVLPGGFFLIVHRASGKLVATSVATHKPIEGLPFSGELGWVAGDPEHKGKGLGLAVCSAVVGRYIEAGYRNIYLKTDDARLPAIKIYLKMGFEPWLFADGMKERWEVVTKKLG
jgi:mycothiol synthase